MSAAIATSERRIITSAIATLIYQDQSYLENGIAFDDLIKAASDQESKYSKKQLENIVNKELSSGSLVKLPNGNLALGPADHDVDSSDSFRFESNADSNTKVSKFLLETIVVFMIFNKAISKIILDDVLS